MGPMCPVATSVNPCPDIGWVGEIKFTAVSGATTVIAKTDKTGKFAIALPPNSYGIALVGPNPMDGGAYETLPAFHGPTTATVGAGQAVNLEFAVDTGIR
jgi:hypothetical protein